jgi:hypothetical protein
MRSCDLIQRNARQRRAQRRNIRTICTRANLVLFACMGWQGLFGQQRYATCPLTCLFDREQIPELNRPVSMSAFAGGVVFAGEDSEDSDEEQQLTIDTRQGANAREEVEESAQIPVSTIVDDGIKAEHAILEPAQLMANGLMENIMPRLNQAEEKLKELSESQIRLTEGMKAQRNGLYSAPGLHKTHEVMRQVPLYQKKIDNLRSDMKAISTLVERMKKESLGLQLRVQQAILDEARKKEAEVE